MLQIGSQVVYGIHGVCRILELEVRTVDRKKVEYFVLEPREQPGARFYVPAHNQAALAKLRPLLTPEALNGLLESEEAHRDCWIPEENLRKQKYRELINGADRAALISMVRVLYKHRESQLAAGRKFHLCDENFLRDAQKLLISEFSMVLGIPQPEVKAYIEKKLHE
ncbi:MAG: CarD family transcriptional regulator [Oscillospiraceae bacterium]|nr:CarD family transcriptional regulator [Oscillospiraceae bacterium]